MRAFRAQVVAPHPELYRASVIGLPTLRFQPLDVHALLPQGRLRVPRVAACVEILRETVADLA